MRRCNSCMDGWTVMRRCTDGWMVIYAKMDGWTFFYFFILFFLDGWMDIYAKMSFMHGCRHDLCMDGEHPQLRFMLWMSEACPRGA